MEFVLLILRIFLFAIFFVAGIGKLLDLKGSEKALEDFGMPSSLSKPFSVLLPIAEILFAVLLLFVTTSWFGAIGASLLLVMFIGGILWQMKKGNAPDCHCFGQIHSEPVGKKSLWRNVIFAVLGLVLVVSGQNNQGLPISELVSNFADAMQLILGVIIIGFLCVLMLYLKRIIDQQTQIMRRLEGLEIISNDGAEISRNDLASPYEGLPIGSPVPDFEVSNVNGRIVTFEYLLMKRKPILFLNVSTTCKPCEALLPDIEKWEIELADNIHFVFISRGKAKENLAKFDSENSREILLQDDREVSELLELQWTPTALFVNSNGMIASRPTAGDAAIRELIEAIKSQDLDDEFTYVVSEDENGDKPKIGEEVPEFDLSDLNGKQVSPDDFQGKKTLVAFWSMTCPHCTAMIDELSDWDKIKGQDEPNLIVFSDGEAEKHKELKINSTIVLDKDYETAQKLGMSGTPSAVMVNENGKIMSETAVGANQIWALLGKKK